MSEVKVSEAGDDVIDLVAHDPPQALRTSSHYWKRIEEIFGFRHVEMPVSWTVNSGACDELMTITLVSIVTDAQAKQFLDLMAEAQPDVIVAARQLPASAG